MSSVSRRDFVQKLSAFGLALAGVPRFPVWIRPRFVSNPFTLGVASGDPSPNGMVLWTRLAPEPLSGGGMPNEAVRVRWEIAEDEAMTRIVRHGDVMARPDLGHSVHAEVSGLAPGAWYWYRFDAGGVASPVGRTRTTPASSAVAERFRFAFVSCQHYESGLYTAYQHLAGEDLDLVAHLGDYIYEYNIATTGPNGPPRHHGLAPATTLELYRNRYARYKSDPDLQAAHRNFPWIVTWDDHEVENNYAGLVSPDSSEHADRFRLRRAAAYQAYYEHQPLRKAAIPKGPDALLYRTIDVGALARFHVLDTRQYRSDQSCNDGLRPACPEWSDPHRTMMGDKQERWFDQRVDQSRARWNVIAQQVALAPVYNPTRPELIAMDPWSGYPVARDRLIESLARRQDKNFVVLTGDIHANFVMDVHERVQDVKSPTVATEFIGTSISSAGDGLDRWPQLANYERDMPSMRYHSARRGYVTCEVKPDEWLAAYREVPFVTRPGAPVRTAASFSVARGRPGAERVR